MDWWDRYQAWQLESRARYMATGAGLRTLIVFLLLWLVSGSSAGKALLLTTIFAVLATLVYGWVWYPRAKTKSQRTSVTPSRT